MSLPLSLDFGGPISSYQPTVFTVAESISAVLSPTDFVLEQKNLKKAKKAVDNSGEGCYYNQALERCTKTSKSARVVELVDSPASGAGAHSGRGGSTPPSRTSSIPEIVMISGIVFFVAENRSGGYGPFSQIPHIKRKRACKPGSVRDLERSLNDHLSVACHC